jgi:hypothetical protein
MLENDLILRRTLWLCGAAMALIFVAFAWRYPLAGNANRLADLGTLSVYSVAAFAGYAGGVTALFALYAGAWWVSRQLPSRGAVGPVFACGGAMVLAMGTMYPVSAIDLFIYAVRSRLFTTYGVDPIAVPPNAYPADPLMRFASAEWADDVSPYGPLWNLIAAPATWLAGDRIAVALVAFKVLAGLSVILGAWLIYRIVVCDRPDDAATAALVYLWNPLVLWEGVGNGHNDAVLVLPLLLALLSWRTRRDRWLIPFLVVAALIKYVTLLVIPLAAVTIWRRQQSTIRRWELFASITALSLAAMIVGCAPFYDLGAARRSIERQGDIFLTSPAAVAVDLLSHLTNPDPARTFVELAGGALLGVCLLRQFVNVWRQPAIWPSALFEALFAYLLIAAWQFRSWYLIWLVAVAAVAAGSWSRLRVLAWTAAAMAAYALFIWGWHWWHIDFATIQRVAVLLMFGPPVIVSILGRIVTRRVRAPASKIEAGARRPRLS